MSSDDYDGNGGQFGGREPKVPQEREAIHLGHDEVEDDGAGTNTSRAYQIERLDPVRHRHDVMTVEFQ